MVFGGISSADLYDRLSKVVLWMALTIADFPHHLCVQHLDDVCAASPAMSQAVEKFYETYREVCQEVGVELTQMIQIKRSRQPRMEWRLGLNIFAS